MLYLVIAVFLYYLFPSVFCLTRLIIIGDSVDRYATVDFCENVGGTLHHDFARFQGHGGPRPFATVFKRIRQREPSLEIHICDASKSTDAIVGFVFNKIGLANTGPWWQEQSALWGLHRSTVQHHFGDISQALQIAIGPALELIPIALGGPPDGVLMQSGFWDMGHRYENLQVNHYGPVMPLEDTQWLNSWAHNVSLFIRLVKETFTPRIQKNTKFDEFSKKYLKWLVKPEAQPQLPNKVWIGWRTSNAFQVKDNPTDHINTAAGAIMLERMNNASRYVSKAEGVELVDWYGFTNFSRPSSRRNNGRDPFHPSPGWSGKLIPHVLDQIRGAS